MRALLDRTPVAAVALALMKEATGRDDPAEAIRPARPERLAPQRRIGFWSLAAGMGTSTVAALVAQRSAGAGHAPLLADLDRWAPSLALRARIDGATVCDALVQPDREHDLVSRWSDVPFLPGSPQLHRDFDAARVVAMLDRLTRARALVVDLGAGADALDAELLRRLDRLCVVTGGRAAQLQATFCGRELLRAVAVPVGVIVVGVERPDALLIAERTRLPLLGAVPHDPYLARDEYAARATTMRAIDALIREL